MTTTSQRLEKLCIDADVNPELRQLLISVGFDVADVRIDADPGVLENDVEVLKWARKRRRIVVCHDRHRQKSLRVQLYPEIKRNGGKIITVGSPDDDPLFLLGLILTHRPVWSDFFSARRGGKVFLSKERCKKFTADDLFASVQPTMFPRRDAPTQVGSAKPSRSRPRRRRPAEPRASAPLGLDDVDGPDRRG